MHSLPGQPRNACKKERFRACDSAVSAVSVAYATFDRVILGPVSNVISWGFWPVVLDAYRGSMIFWIFLRELEVNQPVGAEVATFQHDVLVPPRPPRQVGTGFYSSSGSSSSCDPRESVSRPTYDRPSAIFPRVRFQVSLNLVASPHQTGPQLLARRGNLVEGIRYHAEQSRGREAKKISPEGLRILRKSERRSQIPRDCGAKGRTPK